MTDSAKPLRLYVSETLVEGVDVSLSPDQTHYVTHVMRRNDGAPILVFNGREGEWLGQIVRTGKKEARIAVDRQTRAQTQDPDLWLLFAPIKRNAIDLMVQKATELGVSTLWPVTTAHTNADRVNLDRLYAIASEAAEQSYRLSLPDVRAPVPLEDAFTAWPADRPLYVLDETGGGEPIAQELASDAAQTSDSGAFVIGPEGGFTNAELDLLCALPFSKPVSLGPRTLRTETAALAALTCWQALCGDWRNSSN